MEDDFNTVYALLALRENLLKGSSEELIDLLYKDSNGNQDTECIEQFLDTLYYLLQKDRKFLYLGKDIYDKVCTVVSNGRLTVTKDIDIIYEKTNLVIRELNSINRTNYEKIRSLYLSGQFRNRTGFNYAEYNVSLNQLEESIKQYMSCDFHFFYKLFVTGEEFRVDDNAIEYFISSVSFYSDSFPYLFEDEECLNLFVYMEYVFEESIDRMYYNRIIDKDAYNNLNYVVNNIKRNLNPYIKKKKIKKEKIKEIKLKARTSVH